MLWSHTLKHALLIGAPRHLYIPPLLVGAGTSAVAPYTTHLLGDLRNGWKARLEAALASTHLALNWTLPLPCRLGSGSGLGLRGGGLISTHTCMQGRVFKHAV